MINDRLIHWMRDKNRKAADEKKVPRLRGRSVIGSSPDNFGMKINQYGTQLQQLYNFNNLVSAFNRFIILSSDEINTFTL